MKTKANSNAFRSVALLQPMENLEGNYSFMSTVPVLAMKTKANELTQKYSSP